MLAMWTLYRRPRDFPDHEIIARKWIVGSGGLRATSELLGFDSLDEAREAMEEMGLFCLPRQEDDEPLIIETWM